MLITNDGSWSRRLTQPQTKLAKIYYVETEQPDYARYANLCTWLFAASRASPPTMTPLLAPGCTSSRGRYQVK